MAGVQGRSGRVRGFAGEARRKTVLNREDLLALEALTSARGSSEADALRDAVHVGLASRLVLARVVRALRAAPVGGSLAGVAELAERSLLVDEVLELCGALVVGQYLPPTWALRGDVGPTQAALLETDAREWALRREVSVRAALRAEMEPSREPPPAQLLDLVEAVLASCGPNRPELASWSPRGRARARRDAGDRIQALVAPGARNVGPYPGTRVPCGWSWFARSPLGEEVQGSGVPYADAAQETADSVLREMEWRLL